MAVCLFFPVFAALYSLTNSGYIIPVVKNLSDTVNFLRVKKLLSCLFRWWFCFALRKFEVTSSILKQFLQPSVAESFRSWRCKSHYIYLLSVTQFVLQGRHLMFCRWFDKAIWQPKVWQLFLSPPPPPSPVAGWWTELGSQELRNCCVWFEVLFSPPSWT
jgi:hypothetical protein